MDSISCPLSYKKKHVCVCVCVSCCLGVDDWRVSAQIRAASFQKWVTEFKILKAKKKMHI